MKKYKDCEFKFAEYGFFDKSLYVFNDNGVLTWAIEYVDRYDYSWLEKDFIEGSFYKDVSVQLSDEDIEWCRERDILIGVKEELKKVADVKIKLTDIKLKNLRIDKIIGEMIIDDKVYKTTKLLEFFKDKGISVYFKTM